MIRVRFVVGIRDESLSERLQMESDLDLEKAKKLVRQSKAVQQQHRLLKSSNETLKPIVKSKTSNKTAKAQRRVLLDHKPLQRKPTPRQPPVSNPNLCRRCGKASHPKQSCPARDTICFRCNQKGHFGAQCLSTTVAEITDSLQDATLTNSSDGGLYSDTIYLQAVKRNGDKQWNIEVLVEKHPVIFKVDTGAEVTALSHTTFNSIQKSMPQLKRSNQTLCGPNRYIVGEKALKMTYKGKSCAYKYL